MRAWLTPDLSELEEVQVCRQIVVPVPLLPYVNGALELLAKESNWELYGDATPEQMAQAFMNIIDETAVSECVDEMIRTDSAAPMQLFNQSGTGQADIIINQASLPSDMQGCLAVLISLQWTSSGQMQARLSTQNNRAISYQTLNDYAASGDVQVVCPMNATGGKVRVDALNSGASWNMSAYLVGAWF